MVPNKLVTLAYSYVMLEQDRYEPMQNALVVRKLVHGLFYNDNRCRPITLGMCDLGLCLTDSQILKKP